jgi:hypothetical protein
LVLILELGRSVCALLFGEAEVMSVELVTGCFRRTLVKATGFAFRQY